MREAETDRGNEERGPWVFWPLFTTTPNKERDECCHGRVTVDNTAFSFHAQSCQPQYATNAVDFIGKIKSTQRSVGKC